MSVTGLKQVLYEQLAHSIPALTPSNVLYEATHKGSYTKKKKKKDHIQKRPYPVCPTRLYTQISSYRALVVINYSFEIIEY